MGEGNGTPPQYSCLENPMDGGIYIYIFSYITKIRIEDKINCLMEALGDPYKIWYYYVFSL